MYTHGYLIGKIVDDLAKLKMQINLYNGANLYNINKYSEDFICRLLNLIYSYDLKNLNSERSNEPGIDLGCSTNKIAFQVTSTKTSKKVNDTLRKITEEQKATYNDIKLIVLGEKQNLPKLANLPVNPLSS